jgi:2-polyprenyl-6-methoxyphenol hydroxylase-like FAD-dependent oxidoreductase
MSTSYDVVIVGGGVAGLAAAIGAGRAGVARVLLVDRRPSPAGAHRGELLQPAAVAVLDRWGVAAELRRRGAIGVEALECRDARGRVLGAFDYTQLAGPFDHGLVHHHAHIRGALLAEAARTADVRFGARAVDLLHDDRGRVAGVLVETGGGCRRIHARLLVAADGAGSGLRRRLAIPLRRTVYPHQFAAFDLPAPSLPRRVVAFLTRQGARIVCPMPRGWARLYAQVGDHRRRSPGEWRRLLLGGCPGLAGLLELDERDLAAPQRFGAWRALAAAWTRPGAVLVGDAAHSVHPVAGQGMHASIVDAAALWEALGPAAASSDGAVDRALAAYERGRRPQVDEVAHLSDRLARLCTTSSPAGLWLVSGMLRRNRGSHGLRLAATRRLAGLEHGGLGRRAWLRVVTGR